MSEESVKTVRAVFEAVNTRDVDRLVPLYTDDAVVDMSEAIGPENDVYRGMEAAATWWRDALQQWDSYSWEMESVTELPPDSVVTSTRVDASGRASGIDITARIGQHWRVRDGRVAYVKMFQSEEEALEAARGEGAGAVSADDVATVRAVYDAVNAQEVEALIGLYDEDVFVDVSESISPNSGVLRGRDAAERWWRDWLESWETWTWDAERITEVAPDAVVVATRVRGCGRGSGIEVDARVGQLWRVAGGRVTYVKLFQTEEEALAAAGGDGAPG